MTDFKALDATSVIAALKKAVSESSEYIQYCYNPHPITKVILFNYDIFTRPQTERDSFEYVLKDCKYEITENYKSTDKDIPVTITITGYLESSKHGE